MAQHSSILKLLTAEDLAELEAFASAPARTIDACLEWITAKGYVGVSWSAVQRWKQKFDQLRRNDAASELAMSVLDAATRGKTAIDLADASLLTIGRVIFEAASSVEVDDVDAIRKLATANRNLVATKAGVEMVREEMRKLAEESQRRAVAAAEKTANAGGSGAQVVAAIKSAMGF
ncbi:phage protein Gp27 family protein [Humisphaera borealis]|uniref:DUF3486 family protein n=1 Tax=Humisphaera borealis TaxID=2807512 RepID=A0A7M2X2B8_9BACT|nr:phage protein Gp27 family protein [Humisphaera borealis]QOV90900.1 DUF3486 family protein [Humisphaera borealis]